MDEVGRTGEEEVVEVRRAEEVVVEEPAQLVEVLIQTGTEMVHGQSVMVSVVAVVMVWVLPAWTMVVGVAT